MEVHMSKIVTYEITKEMVNRITPNQTFDGYKDIAQKIGVVIPGEITRRASKSLSRDSFTSTPLPYYNNGFQNSRFHLDIS